jgi:hypothetical protein
MLTAGLPAKPPGVGRAMQAEQGGELGKAIATAVDRAQEAELETPPRVHTPVQRSKTTSAGLITIAPGKLGNIRPRAQVQTPKINASIKNASGSAIRTNRKAVKTLARARAISKRKSGRVSAAMSSSATVQCYLSSETTTVCQALHASQRHEPKVHVQAWASLCCLCHPYPCCGRHSCLVCEVL